MSSPISSLPSSDSAGSCVFTENDLSHIDRFDRILEDYDWNPLKYEEKEEQSLLSSITLLKKSSSGPVLFYINLRLFIYGSLAKIHMYSERGSSREVRQALSDKLQRAMPLMRKQHEELSQVQGVPETRLQALSQKLDHLARILRDYGK